MKELELAVGNKRISVSDDYIMIWDKNVWDGKDQVRLEELLQLDNDKRYVGYDRADGVPYYWSYPDEDVVDVLDALLTPLMLLECRGVNDNGTVRMLDGRTYRVAPDKLFGEYLLDVDCDARFYLIKRKFYDLDGNISAYLVTRS